MGCCPIRQATSLKLSPLYKTQCNILPRRWPKCLHISRHEFLHWDRVNNGIVVNILLYNFGRFWLLCLCLFNFRFGRNLDQVCMAISQVKSTWIPSVSCIYSNRRSLSFRFSLFGGTFTSFDDSSSSRLSLPLWGL